MKSSLCLGKIAMSMIVKRLYETFYDAKKRTSDKQKGLNHFELIKNPRSKQGVLDC